MPVSKLSTSVIILDPSLRGKGGHNLEYVRDVATAMRSQGWQVSMFGAAGVGLDVPDVVPAIYTPHLGIRRKLRALLKKQHQDLADVEQKKSSATNVATDKPAAQRPGILRRLWTYFAYGVAGLSVLPILGRHGGASGIFIEDCGLRELIFLPFVIRFSRKKISSIHCVFRNIPKVLSSNFVSELWVLRRINKICDLMPSTFIYVDTISLKEEFEATLSLPVSVLPIPFPSQVISAPKPVSHQPVLWIGFMGLARMDKGFGLLPALISTLQQRTGLDWHLDAQIDLQNADAQVRSVSQKLHDCALSNSARVAIHQESGYAEYACRYASLDVSLLLYDHERYRHASSGIFVEAVNFGVPVVVMAGSWAAAKVIEAHDMGFTIGECVSSIDEAVIAIEKIATHLASYKAAMSAYRGYWENHNTWSGLFEIIASNYSGVRNQ